MRRVVLSRFASIVPALLVALVAALLMASSLALPASVAADGELGISIVEIDAADFPTVRVVVVADAEGRPIDTLGSTQIQVDEGPAGQTRPAVVLDVAEELNADIDLGVILGIDTSGSMAGEPIDAARTAARSLVGSLRAGDSVGLLAFADTVEVRQPLTIEHERVAHAIDGLQGNGNTALYDAIVAASETARAATEQRTAVILLSDGEDYGGRSTHTRTEAIDAATSGRSVFYVVGLGSEIDQPLLEEIAAASGGRFFAAQSLDDVGAIYASLEQLLRSRHVVTFESSAAPGLDEARELRIEIATDAGSGVATRTYQSSPAAVTPATPTPETPAATPAQATSTPVATPSGSTQGSASPVPFAIGGAVVSMAVVAALLLLRRRRRPAPPRPVPALDSRPLPIEPGGRAEGAAGYLEVLAGPDHALVFVDQTPVTIGSSPECGLRLPGADGLAPEHARIWSRDGRAMIHHLARGLETRLNGRPTEWAAIAGGDVIELGPWSIRYHADGGVSPERE